SLRAMSLKLEPSLEADALLDKVEGLEAAYDTRIGIERRLELLGELLEQTHTLPTLNLELLVLAAACRALYRLKQPEMLELPLSRYRALSLSLTSGASSDALGVLDIKSMQSVNTTWLGRTAEYASMTYAIAKAVGHSRLARLLSGRSAPSDFTAEEIERLSKLVFSALSQLKGPVMKLGQLAAYCVSELPAEARAVLEGLQDASTPVAGEVIRARLVEELGPLERVFANFSDVPIGTGSIGQVHAARLLDGTEVAVKVQYPGIARAVAVDMRVLRSLAPVLKLLFPQLKVRALVDELERRVWEECDYRREARLQQQFHEKFKAEPGIYVPKVFEKYTTSSVLVSELARGRKYSEFVRGATQDERNRAGTAIIRFVVSSCRDGVFNTDPHPGNYVFQDDRVVFLDFGSVKEWAPEHGRPWFDLICACAEADFEKFKSAFVAMEMTRAPSRFDYERAFRAVVSGEPGQWTTPGIQRFDLKMLEKQLVQLALPSGALGATVIPPEYLFGFRVYFGHVALVARLGTEADSVQLVREIMSAGK
ncbi:MAG TPA: AarF/ABC1/UbiB kinase family protein, partial [Bdellovibrionales bacterium]|nr:AarF/ABC1/UbiB kinase family protein [Bdellovibrionales bacterium]